MPDVVLDVNEIPNAGKSSCNAAVEKWTDMMGDDRIRFNLTYQSSKLPYESRTYPGFAIESHDSVLNRSEHRPNGNQ